MEDRIIASINIFAINLKALYQKNLDVQEGKEKEREMAIKQEVKKLIERSTKDISRETEKTAEKSGGLSLLDQTYEALEGPTKSRERAWRYLHAARRLSLFLLNEEECKMEARFMKEEATKLKKWRRDAVHSLLASILDDNTEGKRGQATSSEVMREILFLAARIRDEHYENVYFKIAARKKKIQFALPVLTVALVGVVASLSWIATDWQTALGNLLTLAFLGGLGASFSVAYTLSSKGLSESIPDEVLWVNAFRTLTGAAAAIAAYVLFSGLDLQLNGKSLTTTELFWAVAFIAGFSESFIVRTVAKVENRNEE